MKKLKKVFIAGCFDLFHEGHRYLLSEAAKQGRVYVSLDSDEKVRKNKGMGRPIDNILKRAQNLKDSGYVYEYGVYVHDDNEELAQIISLIEPDYIMTGNDYTPDQIVGRKEMVKWGGAIIIIPRIKGISTTSILENAKKD